jgi:hypothetical protein
MLLLCHHVDDDRHPCHRSSMDQLLVLQMVCDMEIHQLLHLDEVLLRQLGEVLLRQLGEVLLDLMDVLQNLDVLRQGDCLTSVDAHLDELVGWQVVVELLHQLPM